MCGVFFVPMMQQRVRLIIVVFAVTALLRCGIGVCGYV